MNVIAKDPTSGTTYSFSDVASLDGAIRTYHYIPLRSDGTPMIVQQFEGGFVLDGAPLNVYIEGRWYQGQKEALQAEWDANTIPRPATSVFNLPVVPMPADVAQNFQSYQSSQSFFSQIPTWAWIAGGVAVLYFSGVLDHGE